MKRLFNPIVYIFTFSLILFLSCTKELSETFPNPPVNGVKPVANAGPDKVITLPANTVTLDGTASKDEDGTISSFMWTKISGPETFILEAPASAITTVKSMVEGAYQFQLTVTDNSGLIGKDTVQITVNKFAVPIKPIAKAGQDKVLVLPENSTDLDGTASNDPNGSIVSYLWTKVSGPPSYLLERPSSVVCPVKNLVEGNYLFELAVTDNEGLTGKDSVLISVNAAIPARKTVNISLTQVGTIPAGLRTMAVSTPSKIAFITEQLLANPAIVTILNSNGNNVKTTQLPRVAYDLSTGSSGNKIFFGGGHWSDAYQSILNIYDVETDQWDTIPMPEARSNMGVGAVGNKILFAGGISDEGWDQSSNIDMYDLVSRQWLRQSLTAPKYGMNAVTCGNKIYFAGGTDWLMYNSSFNYAEVYDNANGNLYTVPFNTLSGKISGLAKGDIIYWAGTDPSGKLGKAEVWNTSNGEVSVYSLSYPRSFPAVVSKEQYILFGTPSDHWFISNQYHNYSNKVDIYNTNTGEWLIGILPYSLENAAYISINNTIFLAGGNLASGGNNTKIFTLSW